MSNSPKNSYPSLLDFIDIPKIQQMMGKLNSEPTLENTPSNKFSNYNYFIGDNLHGMKSLYSHHAETFHLAFVDPPYNSNQDFIVNDYLNENVSIWKNGTSHKKWTRMMYSRLFYVRELLDPISGLVFFCIDDKELMFAQMLLNHLFGEHNYIGTIIWQSLKDKKANALFTFNHTYILVYAKDKNKFKKELSQIGIYSPFSTFSSLWTDLPSSIEVRNQLITDLSDLDGIIPESIVRYLNPKPQLFLDRILSTIFYHDSLIKFPKVLDPFAGTGSLLLALSNYNYINSTNIQYYGFQYNLSLNTFGNDTEEITKKGIKFEDKHEITAGSKVQTIPDVAKLRISLQNPPVSVSYYSLY